MNENGGTDLFVDDEVRGKQGRRSLRKKLLVGLTALAAIIVPGAALGATADEPPPHIEVLGQFGERTAFTGPMGRVYGFGDSGYVAIGGDPIERVCGGQPPETLGITKQRANGTWANEVPFGGVDRQLYLYKVDVGVNVFQFIGATCASLAEGGEPPETFASGIAVQRAEQWDLAKPFWNNFGTGQQPGRYRNSLKGDQIFDAEGNRYRVEGVANYRVNEDGPQTNFKNTLKVIPRG